MKKLLPLILYGLLFSSSVSGAAVHPLSDRAISFIQACKYKIDESLAIDQDNPWNVFLKTYISETYVPIHRLGDAFFLTAQQRLEKLRKAITSLEPTHPNVRTFVVGTTQYNLKEYLIEPLLNILNGTAIFPVPNPATFLAITAMTPGPTTPPRSTSYAFSSQNRIFQEALCKPTSFKPSCKNIGLETLARKIKRLKKGSKSKKSEGAANKQVIEFLKKLKGEISPANPETFDSAISQLERYAFEHSGFVVFFLPANVCDIQTAVIEPLVRAFQNAKPETFLHVEI